MANDDGLRDFISALLRDSFTESATGRTIGLTGAVEEHLLPVLRSRQAAVEERVAELFPRVRTSRSRSSVDAGGWFAGRPAAERADVRRRASSLR